MDMVPSRNAFDGVKVISATMIAQRGQLGEAVTDWIGQHPSLKIVDVVVRQSSDSRFHCVSVTIFYRGA